MAKVLVVVEEFGIADLLDMILSDEGHQVVTAMNGKDGLEALARERPDLILSDYMMPVMDGAAMLARIKGDAALREIPVAMMSSMPEEAVAERCADHAAFLRKPFKLDEVLALVERLIGRADTARSEA